VNLTLLEQIEIEASVWC